MTLVLQLGRQGQGRLGGGPLPGDDHRIGPLQGAQTFAPGPGRQRPANGPGSLGADHRDVEVPPHVQPLVGVVQHQHLRSPGEGPLRTGGPVRIGDHPGLGYGMLVHQRFVVAVPPQQDAGHQPAGRVVLGHPDGDRGLARPTHGEIPDGDRWQRQIVHREPAAPVGRLPRGHGAAPQS